MNASTVHAGCPFERGCAVNVVCEVCVYAWWSHPDGVSDFQHVSPPHLTEVTSLYRKRSSHIVLQCRQIAYNNR